MDDTVVLEPLVGVRPWASTTALEQAMTRVWGKEAVNPEKKEAEGEFATEQVDLWPPHGLRGKEGEATRAEVCQGEVPPKPAPNCNQAKGKYR